MYIPYRIPISVKGVIFEDGRVWLRKNERGEWELPGGKLDRGEQPVQTVSRELHEELGFRIEAVKLIDAYLHVIHDSIDEQDGVLVLYYLCQLVDKEGAMETIGEAGRATFRLVDREELKTLNMPQFYRVALEQIWPAF